MSQTFDKLVSGLGDEGAFLDRHPYPALILEAADPKAKQSSIVDTGKFRALSPDMTLADLEQDGEDTCVLDVQSSKKVFTQPTNLVDPRAVVVFLQKSNRNPFASLITLGRAKNNDIVIDSDRVSKMHAVMQRESGGSWSIQDWNSTNGTWLNAMRLPAKEKHILESGSQLRFGVGITGRFFAPEMLYQLAALAKG